MKAYFYHTEERAYLRQHMERGEFPRHYVYGMTHWQDHGIEPLWHPTRILSSRFVMMLYNSWHILTCRESYGPLFATHYRGIEPIVMLRALGLYRHPIVVWHHQPVIRSRGWREWVGRVFYRGFDQLLFFSTKLRDESVATGKVSDARCHVGHWGPDIAMYDRVMARQQGDRQGFVSTGKEMRDFPTLIKGFAATGSTLRLFLPRTNGREDYARQLGGMEIPDNVHVEFTSGLIPYRLAREVAKAACVVICCQPTKYTVGLTTLVEALALGLPIITSRNPQFPFDVEQEGCGLCVDYGDVEGWSRAIDYIERHPDEARRMGRRARELAETRYNDEICAADVCRLLRKVTTTEK